MCYTVIWIDDTTKQSYYSQEVANPDKSHAWTEIATRSKACRILALVPGHHSVFFDAEGLTTNPEYGILDINL